MTKRLQCPSNAKEYEMNKKTDPSDLIAEDEPLDPAIERIRARMARLQLVSLGIMFIGLFAVFIAILFKTDEADQISTNPLMGTIALSGEIDLPNGAEILETQIDGQSLLLHLDINGQAHVWVVDLTSLETMSRIKLKN